jgi:hypothetical protein
LLTNLRIKTLKKLESRNQSKENIQDFTLDNLQQIKNNNSLFNIIFKLKEYDLLITENVFNKLDKEYLRKIIINICYVLSIPVNDSVDDMENFNKDNNLEMIILEKATKEKKILPFFNKYFFKIINILIAKKDFSLLEVFAESLLNRIPRKEIPLEMVNYL